MSDSLNATVIVIVWALTISAKGELEPLDPVEEEPELPRAPDVAAALVEPLPVDEELDELELAAPEVVDPALTESPGTRSDIDTIVPLMGATSLVSERACSALRTFASALYTDACAEAILPGDGVVVVWLPELLLALELEDLVDEGPVLVDVERRGRLVAGVVVVVVGGGVVVVVVVVVVGGFPWRGRGRL